MAVRIEDSFKRGPTRAKRPPPHKNNGCIRNAFLSEASHRGPCAARRHDYQTCVAHILRHRRSESWGTWPEACTPAGTCAGAHPRREGPGTTLGPGPGSPRAVARAEHQQVVQCAAGWPRSGGGPGLCAACRRRGPPTPGKRVRLGTDRQASAKPGADATPAAVAVSRCAVRRTLPRESKTQSFVRQWRAAATFARSPPHPGLRCHFDQGTPNSKGDVTNQSRPSSKGCPHCRRVHDQRMHDDVARKGPSSCLILHLPNVVPPPPLGTPPHPHGGDRHLAQKA